MDKRVKVSQDELAQIQDNLKEKGYTLDDIEEVIGSDFRNFRYKGHSMEQSTFQKLQEIYDEDLEAVEIEYIDGKGKKEEIDLEKDEDTAELIGIILGDGYLQSTNCKREDRYISANRLAITLHRNENSLQRHVQDLIQKVTGEEPSTHELESSLAAQIIVHSKEAIEALEELGLQTGDKIENQVSVPSWIKEEEKFQERCLRGLIDTDGTIYQQSHDERIIIQFKNHSQPLLQDFRNMCSQIDIETSSGGKNTAQIADQKEVKKFVSTVAPLKSSQFSF
ncbi:hypothetical protein GKQ38_00100 [Candidatus Nanohaloarchaea archaeon]|nr:hypothetical protein GKQ38_00100 [Candidatus Nanohaloarchaea archaeon]